MTARTRLFGTVLVLFGLAAGCMSVGRPIDAEPSRVPASARRDDKGRKSSSDSKTARSDDDATEKDSDEDPPRDGNPFRRREDKTKRAAADRDDDSWMDSDVPAKKGDRSRSETSSFGRAGDLSASARSADCRSADGRGGGLATLDPETRELVEAELRESTPEERRELEHDLAGLDPRLVRAIIAMHRMSRQKDASDRMGDGRGQRPRSDGWSEGEGADNGRDETGRSGRRSPAIDGRSMSSQERSQDRMSDGPARYDSRPALSSNDPWGRGSSAQTPSGFGATGAGSPDFDTPGSRLSGLPPRPGPNYGGPSASNSPTAGGPFATGSPASLPPSNDDRVRNALPARPGDRIAGGFPSGIVPAARLASDRWRWDVSSDPQNGLAAGSPNASVVRAGYDQSPAAPGGSQDQRMAANSPVGSVYPPNRAQNPNLAPNPPPMNVPAGASDHYAEELQRLIGAAESDVARARLTQDSSDADRRRYIEKQVELRMLYLMAGQQERALQAIPGIDAPDQEFWQQMFWAVANYFDGQNMPNRSDRATQTAAQLRTAIHRLQETARLELHNVAFCHEITSYGSYQRFPRDEFSRGQPVLVYAEVNNFKSVPGADGQNLTRLRSTIEIYTPSGGLVDRIAFPEQEDVCRNQRHDYFLSHQFRMPNADKIQLGPHVLKLIVEDLLSQKVAEYSVNFTVK